MAGGPWNNVQLAPPPQAPSYNAPLIGMQLGALLGNLPQDYLQGAQTAQQLRMMQPATGDPTDIRNLLQQLNQRGGLQALSPQISQLIDLQTLQQNPWPIGGQGQGGPVTTMPQQGANTTPGLSSAGSDNKGADSVASLASETFGDTDATALTYRGQKLDAVARVASGLGVDPSTELSPAQAAQARQAYSRLSQAIGGQPQQASAESVDQGGPSTTQAPQQMPAGLPPQQQADLQRLTASDLLRPGGCPLWRRARFKGRADELAKAADDRQAQIQQHPPRPCGQERRADRPAEERARIRQAVAIRLCHRSESRRGGRRGQGQGHGRRDQRWRQTGRRSIASAIWTLSRTPSNMAATTWCLARAANIGNGQKSPSTMCFRRLGWARLIPSTR